MTAFELGLRFHLGDLVGLLAHLAEKLNTELRDSGLQIVGVTRLSGQMSAPDGTAQVVDRDAEIRMLSEQYKKSGIVFPSLIDINQVVGDRVNVKEIPHLLLVGKNGRIRYFQASGCKDMDLLDATIRKLLEEEPKSLSSEK